MDNRPRSREKNVTGGGAGVSRRGSGTEMGPVGGSFGGPSGGPAGRPSGGRPTGSGFGLGGGGRFKTVIVIILIVLFLGGGGKLSGLLGILGGSDEGYSSGSTGGYSPALSGSSSDTYHGTDTNSSSVDRSVAAGSRDKYTNILGDGRDVVTIMVYMCGTDLESKSGMATNDLNEMLAATIDNDKLNLLVYTGGCKRWNNNVVSSSVNQIYKISNGKMQLLESDMGTGSMTKPETLSTFIRYCKDKYPANRNMLIFWDHGGGSVSGYGYDEKNASSGSMNLAGINTALSNGGVKFDFIGFDACLMATIENDLMCANYADYMIASEETEPGVGWYYTNWLTDLSKNTSMDTLDIGKTIVDDFVGYCATKCPGQKTTLSVVDLAELSSTVTDEFKAFSTGTTDLIKSGDYKAVSDARVGTREFAVSSRIDQIDLVNFADNLGTKEGKELANALKGAVKYNRSSKNMSDSYGISIYFPYRKTSNVTKAVSTYSAIGLDDEYSACIREFASVEVSGQAATGGSSFGGSMFESGSATSPLNLLLGQSPSSNYSSQSMDSILSLVSAFAGSSSGSGSALDLFTGRSLSDTETAEYIYKNSFDASKLVWQENSEGQKCIKLSEDQWSLVHSVDLNMFYDDGTGYIDLGLDNVYSFDDDGNLIPDVDRTWVSINSQPVAYYHTDTVDDGTNYTITGYVPALLNGERVKLILIFNNEKPHGYIAGADPDYDPEVTQTSARGLTELKPGDKLDFLCDYYAYDGSFKDSFMLGEQMTVTDDMEISNTYVGGSVKCLYRFTDIYDQSYWTEEVR